jgi:hypothetical protein
MRTTATALLSGFLLAGLGAAAARAQAPGPPPCPPQGDATKPKIQRLNESKARVDEPSDDDIDDTADISTLIAPGDDTQRWQDNTAVAITAFVLDVRDGGMASSNCHSPDPADHDTILDLSPGANVSDNSHRIIAVVTPQWRRRAAANHVDWSTRAIRAKYVQQYVTIRGWLLFNFEAADRSLNTAPLAGVGITRATAWEIHPVTAIALNGDSLEQQSSWRAPPSLYAKSKARNSAP